MDAGPTCEPLASAVAVILAVMADEAVAQRPALRAERPAPTAPASPSSVALEAGGGISAGIIRSVAATAMAGASFSLSPHVLLAAELEASPAETVALSPGTVGIQFFYGSIRACLRTAPSSRFEIGACVAPYLGEIWAEGHGFSRDASASLTWPALGAGLRASGVLWGSLRWLAQAGLVVPALRESFSVDNAGTAYVPPRVAWVATGGLGWELQ